MRMNIVLPLTAAALLLSGCAANVNRSSGAASPSAGVPSASVLPDVRLHADAGRKLVLQVVPEGDARGSADWESFRGEWRSSFTAAAAARNLPFAFVDATAQPPREPGTLVQAVVKDYRYVSMGARIAFGAMTGNAYVDARLRFVDLATGSVVNEQALNTTSSAWQGIFSAMTSKQLEAVARDVVDDVKPAVAR